MVFTDRNWERIYESNFTGKYTLVSVFYRPVLSEAVQYDRLAGYLSLQNLADALQGIESAFETDGEIRIIASKQLGQENKPVLTDDAPLSEEGESRLALIAQMLDEERLHLKIGEPRNNSDSGIFHPKLGIVTDADGNRITFEGSINETYNAWYRNYERFKVHRSWDEVENEYVKQDVKTFERLWNEEHEDVEVTDIDEAIERDILDWQPESDEEIEEHVERLKKSSEPPASEATITRIAKERELLPGALHIAEEISSIDPWPHQRVIADTAASIYPESLLFCDEVGLGKTIEAGLTISRLLTIGEVNDALLLVPATVQPQWQEELLEKFNINVYSYEYSGAQRVLRDAYGIEHSLSDYETLDAWDDSHIGEFVSNREEPTVVLASWHTARRTQNMGMFSPAVHWQEEHPGEPPADRFQWDLTLVDEAHHGRKGTNLYELLTELQKDTACNYVLTATPMQLEITELFDLLRLCDLPDGWNDRKSFDTYFEIQQRLPEALDEVETDLSRTVEEILPDLASKLSSEPDEGLRQLQTWVGMMQAFVQKHEDVDTWVSERIDESSLGLSGRRRLHRVLGTSRLGTRGWKEKFTQLPPESLRFLLELGEETTPVKSRVFRNTRMTLRMCKEANLLNENIPRREIETRSVELGEAEPLYERVETYIDEVYDQSKKLLEGKERTALGFVMTTYRQRLTSSLHAIEESLKRRRESLRSGFTETIEDVSDSDLETGALTDREEVLRREYGLRVDQIGANSPAGERVRQFELSELEEFIARLYNVPEDPKLKQLMRDLSELSARGRDTVIIFTQYTDTLDAIKEKVCLSHSDVGTYSGDGGEIYQPDSGEWKSVSKERVKREFTDTDGDLSILVCTDSASEGLNLQTCDAMICYDLPWNPQRVEQRIGRIDRIGQKNERVLVWNYVYDETVEEDIYERLGERINLFEQAVGPLRPILEGIEGELQSIAMGDSAKSGEDVAAEAEAQSKQAEQKVRQVGLAQELDRIRPEDIIEEAKLYGWTTPHPDVGRIGYRDKPFEPLLNPEVVKHLFTQSQILRNKGWTFEMLDRQLTEDEDAPYQKLYRLEIPEDASPPIPRNPPEDTVQAIYAGEDEVLVSFDPEVLEWYPSVIIPLPHQELFEYLLDELSSELEGRIEDEIIRVAGDLSEKGARIWTEPSAVSDACVATYATKTQRRLTLDVPLPDEAAGRREIDDWLERYEESVKTR
ncbi:DEAD/DEAH box helicase [Halorubrum vacuolatum]|uniref:PLD-like domain-containing protein n=1 Tax=Halorubrum vacuolatum TaxID=63740 RepID=A0A238W8J2_HALVU|nr:helicase-related protein [Halorubrum vacuolatum]SNR42896.1 PLD-like domain-containing protein [Halorubrum vacuolatum]